MSSSVLTMHRFVAILVLTVVLCEAKEIKLARGQARMVEFTGDDLEMRVDNDSGFDKNVFICIGSTPEAKHGECPKGYALVDVFAQHLTKVTTLRLNRDGTLSDDEESSGSIDFEKDGSIKILVAKLPDGVTVTLMNADKVTPLEEKYTDTEKAIIGTSVAISILVVIILIIGLAVGIFIYRKRSTHQPVPTTIPEDEALRTIDDGTHQPPPKSILAPPPSEQQPRPSAETKRTSSSTAITKPSNEKTAVKPKAATSATPVEPKALPKPTEPKPAPTNKPSATPKTTPRATPRTTPTATPKPFRAAKPIRRSRSAKPTVSMTTVSQTTERPNSPSLPVDSTQSPTRRSPTTEPTPDFNHDATADALANNSKCKARTYLHPNEARRPGQPPRQRRHSAPVVDEDEDYKQKTETWPCFLERIEKLGGHDHMRLNDRINVAVQHRPSDAERALLKAEARDAPVLADIVVREAKTRIIRHSLYPYFEKVDWDESKSFWAYLNKPETPASEGYLVMYHLTRGHLNLEVHDLADPKIRLMPLCGLYMLLLDARFPHDFRIKLAAELRRRASRVIPYMQMDALRESAFPTPYLAQAYAKNNTSFIEGLEIHSRGSRMD